MCVKDVTLLKLIVTPKIRNVTRACDPAPTLQSIFHHVCQMKSFISQKRAIFASFVAQIATYLRKERDMGPGSC